jgi:hypothetical protein
MSVARPPSSPARPPACLPAPPLCRLTARLPPHTAPPGRLLLHQLLRQPHPRRPWQHRRHRHRPHLRCARAPAPAPCTAAAAAAAAAAASHSRAPQHPRTRCPRSAGQAAHGVLSFSDSGDYFSFQASAGTATINASVVPPWLSKWAPFTVGAEAGAVPQRRCCRRRCRAGMQALPR